MLKPNLDEKMFVVFCHLVGVGGPHTLGDLQPVVHDVCDDHLGGPHGAGSQEVDQADGSGTADKHPAAEFDPCASVNIE